MIYIYTFSPSSPISLEINFFFLFLSFGYRGVAVWQYRGGCFFLPRRNSQFGIRLVLIFFFLDFFLFGIAFYLLWFDHILMPNLLVLYFFCIQQSGPLGGRRGDWLFPLIIYDFISQILSGPPGLSTTVLLTWLKPKKKKNTFFFFPTKRLYAWNPLKLAQPS